jgi:hypothetical protein
MIIVIVVIIIIIFIIIIVIIIIIILYVEALHEFSMTAFEFIGPLADSYEHL